MEISYHIHKNGVEKLLAIADSNIIGKKFEENGMVLHVDENFYSGKKCTVEEIKELAENADIINAVGENTVKSLVDCEIVDEKMILKIQGVSHAQVIRI